MAATTTASSGCQGSHSQSSRPSNPTDLFPFLGAAYPRFLGCRIVFGAKRALNAWFLENPDYAVRNIDVATDGKLTRDAILKTAGVAEGSNIFQVNLLQLQERLRSLPQVEESRVQRVLPNKLVISIQERRPVAWVVASDACPPTFENAFLVDRRGILLKPKVLLPNMLAAGDLRCRDIVFSTWVRRLTKKK